MRCSSCRTPVAIVAAQTGVTDGNAAQHESTYAPRCTIAASTGARPEAIARSSIAGLRPSMRRGRASVAGRPLPQDPQARVLLALTPAPGGAQPADESA